MIITCNCGEKKFVVPDNSIPASGRMVQCGFCGKNGNNSQLEMWKKHNQSLVQKRRFQNLNHSTKNTKTKKKKKGLFQKKQEKSVCTHQNI